LAPDKLENRSWARKTRMITWFPKKHETQNLHNVLVPWTMKLGFLLRTYIYVARYPVHNFSSRIYTWAGTESVNYLINQIFLLL